MHSLFQISVMIWFMLLNTCLCLPTRLQRNIGVEPEKYSEFFHSQSLNFSREERDEVDKRHCKLQLARKSITKFRHIVYYNDLNYVTLHLIMTDGSFAPSKSIVGVNHWIWTYFGERGGLPFLKWPLEFGSWSFGLLNTFTGGPFKMYLNTTDGNCSSLKVGKESDDLAISGALLNLTLAMHDLRNNQYDPSFWCYRKRMYLNPQYLYRICINIVCPFVAIKHVCCKYYYNVRKQHRELSCENNEHTYDTLLWLTPIFIAVILFTFCPLLLLSIGRSITRKAKEYSMALTTDNVYLDRTDQVTLMKTLIAPVSSVSARIAMCLSRSLRFMLPFLSLTLIGIQIYVDSQEDNLEYVRECVDKGVPMGFRSISSGWKNSAQNFLPYLGGPFVACILYLVITCFIVTMPRSLANTLVSGLCVADNINAVAPLRLTFDLLERYGSTPVRKLHGYKKVYNAYIGQLNLLINIKFWKFVLCIQINRWKAFCTNHSKLRSVLLPLYIILCVIEVLLCLFVYGCPIISFGITIYKAYRGLLLYHVNNRFRKPFVIMTSMFLLPCIIFFLFMFCTIFLDACLYLSRLCIFTYTGIILYPKVSYGYLIFVATVVYYLWDSIQDYSRFYFQLLRMTVSACESIQRANDVEPLVVKKKGFKGIRRRLFEEVIESYSPQRKKVIASFVKVVLILGILGLSVHLLMKTNKFQDLHVIMHVGTTLLICACPKFLNSMCSDQSSRIRQQKAKLEIKVVVKRALGYFTDDEDEEDTD